jgi:hypothetical protein
MKHVALFCGFYNKLLCLTVDDLLITLRVETQRGDPKYVNRLNGFSHSTFLLLGLLTEGSLYEYLKVGILPQEHDISHFRLNNVKFV